MAKRSKKPRITAAEMKVLQVLWDSGPSMLSQVHSILVEQGEEIAYTTVQTQLERLIKKQFVTKTRRRPAEYDAKIKRDEVSRPMLDLLLQRVTGAVPLFAHLVKDSSLSSEDFAEMKRLIAEAEKRQKQSDQSEKNP